MNKHKNNYYLNIFILLSFIISIGFSIISVACYLANIYHDEQSYINLFVANCVFYIISFLLLYIKKQMLNDKYYYLVIWLNTSIIASSMLAVAFSIVCIISYISHTFNDGFLNLFVANLILYAIPLIFLYFKKKLRQKILNQSQ